jgi:hypothetical protein
MLRDVNSAFEANLTPAEHSLVLAGGITMAMLTGNVLSFTYDGKERIVEAHAIGKSTKDGSLLMRGYQIGGEASRPLPQWTLFSIDKIERGSFAVELDTVSSAPREGYAMDDKQMAPVLCQLVI